MKRRLLALVLLTAAIIVVGGGLLAYLLLVHPGVYPLSKVWRTPTPGIASTQPPVSQQECGVTRARTGYKFSWLYVSGGYLMAEKNCIMNLKGFNWSQLEFGNAVGGPPKTRISERAIAWYSRIFQMNVWRIPVNATW